MARRHFSTARTAALVVSAMSLVLGCGDDEGAPKPFPTLTPTATGTATPSPTPQPTAFLIPVLPGAERQVNLANAVSHDGRVVVGESDSSAGEQAFRWTTAGELQGLGFLSGYTQASGANAVSADGSMVVGASTAASGDSRAFAWTVETGMLPLGELPEWVVSSEAFGISADGTIVVGVARGVDPEFEGDKTLCFIWTADEGFQLFGDFLPGGVDGTFCAAHGISANGQVIVGEARYDIVNDELVVQGFRFTRDTGLFPLGWVDNAAPNSCAVAASANGAVIGGSSDVNIPDLGDIQSPMRWTTTVGPVWLGRGLIGAVQAVSGDGAAMAGGAADPGTAFVWDVDNGYRNLYGLLLQTGLADGLDGTSPIGVRGMTPDGRTVVGNSLGEGRVRAFYVRLP